MHLSRHSAAARRFGRKSRRFELESLEDRRMMAFSPEFFLAGDAAEVVTAGADNGRSVVVWTDESGDGDQDVMYQLVDELGQAVGVPQAVANDADVKESRPAVAMDGAGNFVIAWDVDGSDVAATLFDANGNVVADGLLPQTHYDHESVPDVAMDGAGRFVVAYRVLRRQAATSDIHAWMFDADGTLDSGALSSGKLTVANDPESNERAPSVSRADDGRFAIAYESDKGDIVLKRFAASGAPIVNVFQTGDNAAVAQSPDVALAGDGSGVFAWVENVGGVQQVRAMRFSADGVFDDVDTLANGVSTDPQLSVAVTPDGDHYLAAVEQSGGKQVRVMHMDGSSGSDIQQADEVFDGARWRPDLSIVAEDQFFLSYLNDADNGAYGRRLDTLQVGGDDGFDIDLNFIDNALHTWTPEEKDLVRQAADLWEQVIVGDLFDVVTPDGEWIDDVLIDAEWKPQGEFSSDTVIAHATWTARRFDYLPSKGYLELNNSFEYFATDPTYQNKFLLVARHEIGHVLGFGAELWEDMGLLQDKDTVDVRFTGPIAVSQYNAVRTDFGLSGDATSVPLEFDPANPGSGNGHWAESVFDTELMTPQAEDELTHMELSGITVGALADMGYEVRIDYAESYSLPATSSATSVSPGPNNKSIVHVFMEEHSDGDDGSSDTISIEENADQLEIRVNGEFLFTGAADDIFEVVVDGSSDNEHLIVEQALEVPVLFFSDAGHDTYTIRTTDAFDVVSLHQAVAQLNGTSYSFDGVETVRIYTEDGDSHVEVVDFPAVSSLIVNGGADTDNYWISDSDDPAGYVYFNGVGGVDTLHAADRTNDWHVSYGYWPGYGAVNTHIRFWMMENLVGGAADDTFRFTGDGAIEGSIIGGGGVDKLDYSGSSTPVTVFMASLHSMAAPRIGGLVSEVEDIAGSSSQFDKLVGSNQSLWWTIDADNAGHIASYVGNLSFSGFENLAGGAQYDRFRFVGSAALDGILDGAAGRDTLDYSAYKSKTGSGVFVDLNNHKATSVEYWAYGIENVVGSRFDDVIRGDHGANTLAGVAGNDVLLGLSGNDRLVAGADRSVLVGGSGSDVLAGGKDEDLLIGDYTAYDWLAEPDLLSAFEAIRDVWTRNDLTAQHRAQLLRKGVVADNGRLVYLQDRRTIRSDGHKDSLQGGAGADWFWGAMSEVKDFNAMEDLLK